MTSLARANTLAATARAAGWDVKTRETTDRTVHNDVEALGSVSVRGTRGTERFAVLWEKFHPTHGRGELRGIVKVDAATGLPVTDWREVFVYLWTTHHTAVVRGVRLDRSWTKGKYPGQHTMTTKVVRDPALDETVTFTTERPVPRRVTITELKEALP